MKGNAFRDITIMVVILMSIMLLMIPASASSTTVSIGNESVTVGQSVTLPLMVKGADETISSARLVVSYDPAICEVTSVEEGQFDLFESTIDNEKGELNIIGYGIEGLSEDFKIADITFKAIKEGNCELGVNILELKNNKGDPVHAKSINGSLTAKAPTSDEEGVPKPTPTPTITPTTTPALPSPSPPISPSPALTPTPSPFPIATTTPTLTPTPLISAGSKAVVHIGNFSVAEGRSCNAAIIIKNIGESGLSRADIMLEYNPSVVKIESAGGERIR
ncbi:MAG: hypothetical protein KAV25_01345 [Methanophagales archaeon]|nr:hypothetical protein [Methanophagales archaeon]